MEKTFVLMETTFNGYMNDDTHEVSAVGNKEKVVNLWSQRVVADFNGWIDEIGLGDEIERISKPEDILEIDDINVTDTITLNGYDYKRYDDADGVEFEVLMCNE